MLPCWALLLTFAIPLGLPFAGAFVRESPLSWIAKNSSKSGRPSQQAGESWVLHASADWSAEYRDSSKEEVEQALLAAFREATGLPTLPPASFRQSHRWLYSIARDPLEAGCLWDAKRRLGACGDWCHGSRVEGAYLSGLALAERVLAEMAS